MLPVAGGGAEKGRRASPAVPRTQQRRTQFARHTHADSSTTAAAAVTATNTIPPSTVIRSRFRSITERPPPPSAGVARGTKRYLVDDSPDRAGYRDGATGQQRPWTLNLETPVRDAQLDKSAYPQSSAYKTPLLDSVLKPRRLFTEGAIQSPTGAGKSSLLGNHSPARTILDSAQRESEYVSKVEALKRANEKAKFELKQIEMERERDREEAARVRQSLEAELLAQTKRVEKLERDRKWLFGQEERLAEQRREVERDMIQQRERFDAKIEHVVAEYREREQQLEEVTRAFRRLKTEHVSEIEDLQIKLAKAERSAAETRSRLESGIGAAGRRGSEDMSLLQHDVEVLKRDISAKNEHIASLQRQLNGDDEDKDDSKMAHPSQDRIAQLERDLHEQCAYIKAVEQQNRQLRSDVGQLSELANRYEQEREANQALQAKIQRLEEQQESHADLEARFNVLQQEREQWRKVRTLKDGQLDSPYAVAKTVSSQRHTISLLETKVESLQHSVGTTALELQTMARESSTYKKECSRLEEEIAAEKRRAIQLERSKQYSAREAEFLRSQLHSYDSEETSMMAGNYDAQKADRIKQLELFIDEQRAWVSELEEAAASGSNLEAGRAGAKTEDGKERVSSSILQSYREDAEAKERELEAAKKEHQQLLERFEALEREAARLEHQVGSGLGYNPRTTRILQLIDNPSAQDYAIRSEKLKALAAENEALLAHISQLEKDANPAEAMDADDDGAAAERGAADPSTESPFFHTISNLRAENQNLTRQLEDSGKLMRRYKKEWKKKAAELREVVYSILGYRVDFLSNGGVRFTSMYASDVDQSFVFTSGDDNQGVMKLSGGGNKSYLKGLGNDIRYWVQERGSIPGFMSTVTLQNFEASPAPQTQ
ncbi:hypothetical protein GQ54DRAFT_263412 [Martensiomyces pterosporus]|nr:hypothetical protein GQ54DRAFT_263412 [Martensiomyces pterosporus]